ncbi:MAG: hypothetical protein D6737_09620, partial [Chloroflexi bacterium]
MPYTFKQIAEIMDPVQPAQTLKELIQMHRWLPGQNHADITLETLRARHEHPQKVELRLLVYNVFLLSEIRIPIGAIGGSLLGMLGGRFGMLGGALVGTFTDLRKQTSIDVHQKPAVIARAREIGQAVKPLFDIAAFSEAFNPGEQSLILDAWHEDEMPYTATGPAKSGVLTKQSSGLFTLSRLPIVRTKKYIFKNRGRRTRDADAWANKGVLLTEHDLGLERGNLEIYSTHLLNGGGLIGKPSLKQRIKHQLHQVKEIVEFYLQTHNPANIALIVGDFNIDAHDVIRINGKTPYQHLMALMQQINMQDVWQERNGTPGYTTEPNGRLHEICADDGKATGHCDDFHTNTDLGSRIDYIFAQCPHPEHGVMMDITRPRRRAFPRASSAPGYDRIQYLSDHLGLE